MSGDKYDDIIDLPHHQSKNRPHMTNLQRAAQFSAFAALKGFDEEIAETARYTEAETELSEERKGELGRILAALKVGQEIAVTYFLPDKKKAGGAYRTAEGRIEKIDANARSLTLRGGAVLPFDDIIDLSIL